MSQSSDSIEQHYAMTLVIYTVLIHKYAFIMTGLELSCSHYSFCDTVNTVILPTLCIWTAASSSVKNDFL